MRNGWWKPPGRPRRQGGPHRRRPGRGGLGTGSAASRAMAEGAPGIGIGPGRGQTHDSIVAHVALQAHPQLGMGRERHVGREPQRIAASLVTGPADASAVFVGTERVRDAGWGAIVGAEVAKGRPVPRVRLALTGELRRNGQDGGRRPKHVGLSGDRRFRSGDRRHLREGRWRFHGDRRTARRHDHGRRGCRGRREEEEDEGHHGGSRAGGGNSHEAPRAARRSTRTAHVLPSGCPESGQYASSINRFTSTFSSNTGAKSRPRGGWDR